MNEYDLVARQRKNVINNFVKNLFRSEKVNFNVNINIITIKYKRIVLFKAANISFVSIITEKIQYSVRT